MDLGLTLKMSASQIRDSEIEAPLNWLSALMTTDCLLPRVVRAMLAENAGAVATTSKLPLPPRPWIRPLMFRLVSLHVPDRADPCAVTLVVRLNL